MSGTSNRDDLGPYVPAWTDDSALKEDTDTSEAEATLRAWHNQSTWEHEGQALISILENSLDLTRPKHRSPLRSEPTDVSCVACLDLPSTPPLWQPLPPPSPSTRRRREHTVGEVVSVSAEHPDSRTVLHGQRYGIQVTASVADHACPLWRKATLINSNGIRIPNESRWMLEHGVDGRKVYDLELKQDTATTLSLLRKPKGTIEDRGQSWVSYSTCKDIQFLESQLSEARAREQQEGEDQGL